MKLKVETKMFQKMVATASKGSIPTEEAEITEAMAIQLKDNKLTLITAGAKNYLYVTEDKVNGDDFYVVVSVDKFSKLVSKTTSKEIVLEVKKDAKRNMEYLSFKGDGTYKIDLPYDYDGELVVFPDPISDMETELDSLDESEIQLSTVHTLLTTAKASLMPDKDPSIKYSGYYIGDKVITTDTYKICVIEMKLLNRPLLIAASTVELLGEMDKENIKVRYNDDVVIFETPNISVYSTTMEDVNEYPFEAACERTDAPFPSMCSVDRLELVRVLDRLSLFVRVMDAYGVYLTFTRNGLTVSTKSSNGDELVPYLGSSNFTDFVCVMDIKFFMDVVKANKSSKIDLLYGRDDILKIVDGIVSTSIPLADEDGEEEDYDSDDESDLYE